MRRLLFCAAGAAALLSAAAVQAQDAPAASATAPFERADGVLIYPPEFFADARPNTALDMVSRIPGFSINQNNNVRGFSGAVGNVLFDGARPASKNDSLSDLLGRVPADQVERIELIRGGAPGVDMQGYSLVVNVVRRNTATRQHVISSGITVFDDGRFIPSLNYALNGRAGDRIYELAFGTSTSISDGVGTGVSRLFDPSGALLSTTAIESEADGRGLSGRGRWQQPAFGGTIELTGSAHRYDFKYEQNELAAGDLTAIVDSFDHWAGELGLRYERPLSDRMTLEARAIQRINDREGAQSVDDPSTDIRFTYDNLSGESILRASLRFEQSDTLTWEGGLEAAYNFLDAAQALTVGGSPVPLPSDSVLVEELRAEAFASTTWRPRENLTLEGGLRLETSTISQTGGTDTERSFFYPKPRAALAWSPNEENQLRLRVEREVSQLDFNDFAASAQFVDDVIVAGNADLKPQKSWAFEAQWERRFLTEGVFTASLRYWDVTDAIDVVPIVVGTDVFSAPGNIGDGWVSQLELETTIPTDRWGVSGGRLTMRGSWVNSEVTDPTTGELRRNSGQAPFIGYVNFTQDIESWNTTWGAEWQPIAEDTVWRVDEISRFRLQDFVSAWIEYKPQPNLSIRAQAWMIGATRREVVAYDGPRDTGSVDTVEVRDLEPESRIQLRVRRTF